MAIPLRTLAWGLCLLGFAGFTHWEGMALKRTVAADTIVEMKRREKNIWSGTLILLARLSVAAKKHTHAGTITDG